MLKNKTIKINNERLVYFYHHLLCVALAQYGIDNIFLLVIQFEKETFFTDVWIDISR